MSTSTAVCLVKHLWIDEWTRCWHASLEDNYDIWHFLSTCNHLYISYDYQQILCEACGLNMLHVWVLNGFRFRYKQGLSWQVEAYLICLQIRNSLIGLQNVRKRSWIWEIKYGHTTTRLGGLTSGEVK